MRSTQKKGPRTPALIRAKSRGGIAARVYEALQSAQSVAVMSSASLAAIRVSQVINSKWAEAIKLGNLSDGAHGAAADAIARAAGFREPPEPEPATQNTPTKPPPASGGAEACTEIPMPRILTPDEIDIARRAAEYAGMAATGKNGFTSPAEAGKAVVDAYQAALKQLSADSAPDPAPSAASA